jgi:hypothetical protein
MSDKAKIRDSNGKYPVILKLTDDWRCECGKVHDLGCYVAAHWTDRLTHTCDCGRKHGIKNGVLSLTKDIRKGKPK